jgi:uncharacterized protein YjbI with pentapeptide repeats
MADQDQFQILAAGVEGWDAWRREHPFIKISLSDANLSRLDLTGANLNFANLSCADLSYAHLNDANLRGAKLNSAKLNSAKLSHADLTLAKLSHANLHSANLGHAFLSDANLSRAYLGHAYLRDADLTGAELIDANLSDAFLCGAKLMDADLSRADLSFADLSRATLIDAMLRGANLEHARFVNTNLSNASLEGCMVYGVSAWGLTLDSTNQKNLRITPYAEPTITVDDLEVAQFIYLMLNNQKVRHVINTITTKVVLILGRFTQERKATLDALREELRQQDYLPIIFDFDQPATRDLTETVSTLAHMSRFIIADITDPRSIPQELQTIIPHLPSVPVQPLILASEHEYGMFEHFKQYPWVLATHVYESSQKLVADLKEKVIAPAKAKAKGLRR